MLNLKIEEQLDSIHNFVSQQVEKILSKIEKKHFFQKKNKLSLELKKNNIFEFDFVSEINGIEKIEITNKTPVIDRISHSSLSHTLYGYIPNTLAGDNDPVDVFLLFPNIYNISSVTPNTIFKAIPLMKINTLDNKEEDDKVIAIPSCMIAYFTINNLITHMVINIITFLYTQNYVNKEVIIKSLEDHEETCSFINKTFLSKKN